jgi:two-component system response regulator PhoP
MMLEISSQSTASSSTIAPFLDARLPAGAELHPSRNAANAITVFATHDEFHSLSTALSVHGFSLRAAALRKDGAETVVAEAPPLIISDMATPGFSGFDLVRDLRAGGYQGRIFALVERGDLLTSVIALEVGADLVIEKPVEARLLCTYIKKALQGKALATGPARGVLRFGRLTIDVPGRQVFFGDNGIALSSQHFDLLELLARHAGHHVSREQVIEALGGFADLSPRSVDCMVYRLRKRLAEQGISAVSTVRGRGYLFAPRNW